MRIKMKKKIICFLYSFLLFSLSMNYLCAAEKSEFNKKQWDSLSSLEKKIAVLTSVWMEKFGIDYSDFKCEKVSGTDFPSAGSILADDWGIKDKEQLFKKLDEEDWSSFHSKFVKNCQLLDQNPDMTPAQISMKENMSLGDTGRLFYAYDVRSKVGTHGLEAYSLCKKLLWLRLGYGADFISKEEMIQTAEPIVEKALNEYTSFDDFAGHYTAGRAVYTVTLYKYNKNVDYEIEAWNNAKKNLPWQEISFTGTKADKKAVMTIEDGVYVPSDYARPLMELEKFSAGGIGVEGLAVINKCYKKYGELSFIKSQYSYITPVKFDTKGKLSAQDFFDKEYRTLWNSLSEVEQFAIACSSNIFERNEQFHLDFSNNVVFNKNTRKGKAVLNENWEIFNYEDLMENYNELTEGEQNNLYLELKELIEANPDSTYIELAIRDNLNVSAVSRMYFVQDKKEALGTHALEAWIDARRISIIRWAISTGYISREEAFTLLTPVVQKIKDDYKSFDEFIAHWIAGYCFNAVYDSTCPECTEELIAAIKTARAYIPFEELAFTGKNADKNHTMTIEEAVYTPSAEAAKMIPLQKAYKRYKKEKPSVSIYNDFIKAINDYPEVENLCIMYMFVLMNEISTPKERIDYAEAKMEFIKDKANYFDLYKYIVRSYCNDLLRIFQPEKFLEYYKSLPINLQKDDTIYYCYGYAYYLMVKNCESILERDVYISRAKNVFNQLKQKGSSIGDMELWLRQIEAQ